MVVTRFAPSPTGFLHMGGVRTALYSFLFARKHKGTFALRIEDTDKARNRDEWTQALVSDLDWLGLKHDVYAVQSEKLPSHQSYIKKLIDSGQAYISKEKDVKEGQRDEVIRFKNPNKKVTFTDLIRGDITVDTTDLGDFVIARSMEEPVYHLAVVVDDFEMGITHIIRAEEHISNTPRHILIQEAIGAPRPLYAHLPLVLAEDRSKLSKRKHGETVSLTYYRDQGYLPEAILNFMALIGWNPGTDQEMFSLSELIEVFDLAKVQKGGAIFNVEKLKWYNKAYLSRLTLDEFKKVAAPFNSAVPEKLWPLLKERTVILSELRDLSEFDFLSKKPELTKEKLNWKDTVVEKATLVKTKELLETVSDFTKENVKTALWPYAEEVGKGVVLWPLRVSLSGKEKSPDPFILAELLGKEETISRIDYAISLL